MRIKVENTYSDGHESTAEYAVDSDRVQQINCEEDLEDLLWEFTGDGHGSDPSLGCYYTVTVLESDRPELVGYVAEFDG